jgi:hypothetical protein
MKSQMKPNDVPLEKVVNTILLFSPGNMTRVQEVLEKLVPKTARYHLEIKDNLQFVFHNNYKGDPDLRAFS